MGLADQVRKEVSDDLRLVTFVAYREVALETPKRTGRAQHSWNVSVGRPNLSVPPEGSYGAVDFQKAMRVTAGKDLTRQHAFITSNLFYMEILADGRRLVDGRMLGSDQAPDPGWIERAADRALAQVQNRRDIRLGR